MRDNNQRSGNKKTENDWKSRIQNRVPKSRSVRFQVVGKQEIGKDVSQARNVRK